MNILKDKDEIKICDLIIVPALNNIAEILVSALLEITFLKSKFNGDKV